MASQLCSEINGGGCKNKVSARNGFVCAAGHGKGRGVARPTISISEMNQAEKLNLARNTEDKTIQSQLLRMNDKWLHGYLAKNPSITTDTQLELFRTGDSEIQWGLSINLSLGRDLAIELAKVGQVPFGYTKKKSLKELIQPENLALLSQHPEIFSEAYLDRLLDNPQEDKEESKALILHSYLVYEKNKGEYVEDYKDKLLERYEGDQEVTLIISTETA